jgi:PAS domain S-box-containing protein
MVDGMSNRSEGAAGWRQRIGYARRLYIWGTALVLFVGLLAWHGAQRWHSASVAQQVRRRAVTHAVDCARALDEAVHDHLAAMSRAVDGPGLLVTQVQPDVARIKDQVTLHVALHRDGRLVRETSQVIPLSPILFAVGQDGTRSPSWHVALRTMQRQVFYGDPCVFAYDPATAQVSLPDGYWEVGVVPVGGWEAALSKGTAFRLLSALFFLSVTGLVWAGLRNMYRLQQAVDSRTHELEMSVERYRELFDASKDAILLTDGSGRIMATNQRARDLYGQGAVSYDGDDLWGQAVIDVIGPSADGKTGLAESFDLTRLLEATEPVEWPQCTADGRTFIGEVSVVEIASSSAVVATGDGAPVYMITVHDVTARRSVEEARQRHEALISALLNASTDVAILIDPDSVVIAANRAAAARFGLSVDAFVGRHLCDLVEPDVAVKHRARVAEVIRTRRPVRFSDERAGGYSQNTFYPVLDADGRVRQIAVYARDVTERVEHERALREAEARARALFENIGDAFILLDADLRIVEYRDSATNVLGLRHKEVLGMPFELALSACALCRQDVGRRMLQDVLDTGLTQRRSDVLWSSNADDSASDRLLDVVAYRISDAGHPRVALLLRDVTHRRRLAEVLRQQERLEALNAFSTLAAHDFGNVLGIIEAAATLLDEDIPSGHPSRPDVDAILEAADLGARMVKDLIAYSRGEPLILDLLDMGILLQQCAQTVQRQLGKSIALELSLADGPLTVRGNAVLLRRVLNNLVINAREAMPDGGTLTVETRIEELDPVAATALEVKPGTYVLLLMRDTGVGISQEALARIFEPFWTTKRRVGAGLGLSAVQGIVRQHGGAIRVDSQVGQGTTFWLYYPLAIIAEGAPDEI